MSRPSLMRYLVAAAAVLLTAAVLAPGRAFAAAPSVTDTSPAAGGRSAWTYSDLHDTSPKYEGGYARFDDTSTLAYTSSPHGGYDSTTNRCVVCHAVHRAEGSYYLMRGESQSDACVYCHVGSAHSVKTVYDRNPAGMQTGVGHRIGAPPEIPASSVEQTIEVAVVSSTDASGNVTTSTVPVRAAGAPNKMFRLQRRHTQEAVGSGSFGYMRVGPTSLTCMSCHQVHNAAAELWRPKAFPDNAETLTAGYKLLKASPSGSIWGPDDMPYAEGTRTVSYTRGMREYRQFTDFGGTGLVNAPNVVRAPEATLTAVTTFPADPSGGGGQVWRSPAWPEAVAGVNQYALSAWCADCHNDTLGWRPLENKVPEMGARAHESTYHPVPYTGGRNGPAQCYSCHREDLSSTPTTAAYDGTALACERCHYGTGSYALDSVRLSPAGSDWPHSGETSSAYLLGAWTMDPATAAIESTAVTPANTRAVCLRCHIEGSPTHPTVPGYVPPAPSPPAPSVPETPPASAEESPAPPAPSEPASPATPTP